MVDIMSDEWIARANEELHTIKGCPHCGGKRASISRQMTARDMGTFSLSGNQDKMSCIATLILECSECGVRGVLEEKAV
jgi:predicted RNA-binding Zn-ribbon protein involved in translation (DUF1610 family)